MSDKLKYGNANEWTTFITEDNKQVGTILIRHWETEPYGNTGIHRWNIYLIVFDTCKKYNDFVDVDKLPDIPFHDGVTYFSKNTHIPWGKDNNKYDLVKIGCDYNHLYDDPHTHFDVDQIKYYQNDAQKLYNWFMEYLTE